MIDFVRISYKDKDEVEWFITDENNFPEIRAVLEMHSGAIEYPYITKIKNMEVKITENKAYLKNSLHKLNNIRKIKKDSNHNDFKYSELVENINYLDEKLIKLDKTKLSILEFGLNIEIDKPGETIVKDNIIMHNFKLHSIDDDFKGKGKLKQFKHSNYSIKIYDKSKQYQLKNNVLRFEIKHTHCKSYNKYGVFNIHDLTDKNALSQLFEDLLQRFDEMLIVDNYRDIGLPKEVEDYIDKCTSYNYWEILSERKNKNKKTAEKIKFKKTLEKYKLLETKNCLREKLISKFNYLINN